MLTARVLVLAGLGLVLADEITISERIVRVQHDVEFELVARGRAGCFEWVSERSDIAEVLTDSVHCSGTASSVRIRTHSPMTTATGGRIITFVTARALVGEADIVFCEVNVAHIVKLRVEAMVHRMYAHELQWLTLAAYDEMGNAFSQPALDALDVSWTFDPPGLVRQIPPAQTRQKLDSSLAAVGESGRWQHYYRIAVMADAALADKRGLVARATVGGRTGRQQVEAHEVLTVEPSELTLIPEGRAVLAPTMTLQYSLRTCGKEKCLSPYPSKFEPSWFVEPEQIAQVKQGLLDARITGEAVLHVSQPSKFFNASAPVFISPPGRLQIDVLDRVSLDAADKARVSDEAHTLLMGGGQRLVRVSVISRYGDSMKMLLPIAPPKPPAHLLPKLGLDHNGTVAFRTAPAWMCGEECTLEKCPRSGAPCGRTPHPLCLCYELQELEEGTVVLQADLAAFDEQMLTTAVLAGDDTADDRTQGADTGMAESGAIANSTWSMLQSSVTLHLMKPLLVTPTTAIVCYPPCHVCTVWCCIGILAWQPSVCFSPA